jgi:hypothetical protein
MTEPERKSPAAETTGLLRTDHHSTTTSYRTQSYTSIDVGDSGSCERDIRQRRRDERARALRIRALLGPSLAGDRRARLALVAEFGISITAGRR